MSEEQVNEPVNETVDEMTILKERAKLMGLKVSPNIGIEALRAKINAKLEGEVDPDVADDVVPKDNALTGIEEVPGESEYARQQREMLKLVRVRITNMDPKKADLQGEIFTVANEVIGKVSRFVPYGEVTDDGWHLPNFLYQMLKEKKFLQIRTFKDKRTGSTRIEQQWVREFNFEELDPLTETELAELARRQAAINGQA